MKEASNTKPLISELEIHHRISQLAKEIAGNFSVGNMVLMVVLKGGFIFAADLLRRLHGRGLDPAVEFIRASSYGEGEKSTGKVEISIDTSRDLKGMQVLIVDDIIDSGRTLKAMSEYIWTKSPVSIQSCTLLDKPSRREVDFSVDYAGFEIPDIFVVGYGLDLGQNFRFLPFIGTVEADKQNKPK